MNNEIVDDALEQAKQYVENKDNAFSFRNKKQKQSLIRNIAILCIRDTTNITWIELLIKFDLNCYSSILKQIKRLKAEHWPQIQPAYKTITTNIKKQLNISNTEDTAHTKDLTGNDYVDVLTEIIEKMKTKSWYKKANMKFFRQTGSNLSYFAFSHFLYGYPFHDQHINQKTMIELNKSFDWLEKKINPK